MNEFITQNTTIKWCGVQNTENRLNRHSGYRGVQNTENRLNRHSGYHREGQAQFGEGDVGLFLGAAAHMGLYGLVCESGNLK